MDWIAANWPIPAASAGSRRTAARVMWGAISLSSSSHFPLMPYSKAVNPVALPPGCARLATNPAPTGSMTLANTIGALRLACCSAATLPPAVAPRQARHARVGGAKNQARRKPTQSIRVCAIAVRMARSPAGADPHVAAVGPPNLLYPVQERREPSLLNRIAPRTAHQHADPPHALTLLRARRERPRGRSAECGQQVPPSDGDRHTPLPCEVRRGKDTTPWACSLHGQGGRRQDAGCFTPCRRPQPAASSATTCMGSRLRRC